MCRGGRKSLRPRPYAQAFDGKRGSNMARVGTKEYAENYLAPAEKKILSIQKKVPGFSDDRLASALMAEMGRADSKSKTIEISENKAAALKAIETRIIGYIGKNA